MSLEQSAAKLLEGVGGWLPLVGCFVIYFNLVFLQAIVLLRKYYPFLIPQGKIIKQAGRIVSCAHSSSACTIAIFLLLRDYFKAGFWLYDADSTAAFEVQMALSAGYFVADSAIMVMDRYLPSPAKPEPLQVVFLAHHLCCTLFYVTCQASGMGGATAALATLLGEITNPLQNMWYLAKDLRYSRAYAMLSPVFTAVFISLRCAFIPLWSAHIIWYLLTQARPEMRVQGPVMSAMCFAINVGGFFWSWGLWKGYAKFQAREKTKTV